MGEPVVVSRIIGLPWLSRGDFDNVDFSSARAIICALCHALIRPGLDRIRVRPLPCLPLLGTCLPSDLCLSLPLPSFLASGLVYLSDCSDDCCDAGLAVERKVSSVFLVRSLHSVYDRVDAVTVCTDGRAGSGLRKP